MPLAGPARRVVSLVPSLTEAIAATLPGALVGATDWCTHPPDLDVVRVRGTKNPDLAAVRRLAPDLVVANQEENRELDVRRLREAGTSVWVTRIRSVPEGLDSMRRLFADAFRLAEPAWLSQAARLWGGPVPAAVARVGVPVWRDPWLVVGGDTFAGDLLARLGLANAYADSPGRYPAVDVARLDADGLDLVLLPDEPYPFTLQDGPEAFARTPVRLVSGRLLTWYGPSLVAARRELAGLAAATGRAP